jgi:CDP-diacylglycerol--glycerol-3-phosphate 3-phosphatidyltransferase
MFPLNLPNALTLRRILAVPVVVVALLDETPNGDTLAAAVFALAALTDGLDGYFARSRAAVTTFGKLMDPLADKLLITAALVSLVSLDRLQAWVAMVIIAREFAVTGLRLVAASENVIISAGRFGKAKALSQNVALGAIIVPGIGTTVEDVLLGIALVLTVLSGIHYFLVARWRIFATKPSASRDAMGVDP